MSETFRNIRTNLQFMLDLSLIHIFLMVTNPAPMVPLLARLKKKIVVDSLAIGMAPFLMNLAACFIVILILSLIHIYKAGYRYCIRSMKEEQYAY